MGFLNSSALTLRFRYIGKLKGGGVYEYFENTISQLPVVRAVPGTQQHDALVDLVQRRIDLGAERRSAPAGDQDEIEQECTRASREIDDYVAVSLGVDPDMIAALLNSGAGPIQA